jgi:hypothetical protein
MFFLMHLFSGYLLHLKGLWFRPSPKEVAANVSTLQPVRQPESCNLLLDSCLVITMAEPCCPMIPVLCFVKWQIVLLWFLVLYLSSWSDLYTGFMRNRWRTNYPMDIIQSPVRISSRQYIIHSKGTSLPSLWRAEGTVCWTSYVTSVGIDYNWRVGALKHFFFYFTGK